MYVTLKYSKEREVPNLCATCDHSPCNAVCDQPGADDEEEFEEVELTLPAKYEVCPRCKGTGRTLAPGYEGVAFTQEDLADQDPDFEENYFGGGYDVDCTTCDAKRVVLVPDESRLTPEQEIQLQEYQEYQRDEAEYNYMARLEREAEYRMGGGR